MKAIADEPKVPEVEAGTEAKESGIESRCRSPMRSLIRKTI